MGFVKNLQKKLLIISSRQALVNKIQEIIKSDFRDLLILVSESAAQGLSDIYNSPPDILIIDSMLSDISGMQICRILKHDPPFQKLPIVMIVQDDNREHERFTELFVIADTFVKEKKIEKELCSQLKRLLELFNCLDESEMQPIRFLQQQPLKVQPLNRMAQLFDQSITEVAIMQNFRKLFELSSNKNILHHMLFNLLENLLNYDVAGIFFNDRNRDSRLITYHAANDIYVQDHEFQEWTDKVFKDLKQKAEEPWVFREARYEVIASGKHEIDKPIKLKHLTLHPFFIESTLVGALVFLNRKKINYDLIFPFAVIMQEMSALMRIRRYYSEVETLAISDSLTSLYTHQHFLWFAGREIRHTKRHKSPLTLAIISIDNMRQINTVWGYEAGDHITKAIAQIALQNSRCVDLWARSGGRTMMGLFPNTTSDQALMPIKRIRDVVMKQSIEWHDKPVNIDLSIGLATLSADINSSSDFIALAQKAVDQAREEGQNCIKILQYC